MNVPMRRLFPCLSWAVLTLSLAARDIPVKNAAELKAAYDAIKPPSKTEQKKAAEAEVRTPGILRQKQWLP
jgi:hypothetical protein